MKKRLSKKIEKQKRKKVLDLLSWNGEVVFRANNRYFTGKIESLGPLCSHSCLDGFFIGDPRVDITLSFFREVKE